MAVQADDASGSKSAITAQKATASALAGLKIYWNEHNDHPLIIKGKWLKLFTVTKMVEHSVSFTELTRTDGVIECQPW